jgi:redox-sensing transcriptional repressor
VRYRKIPNETIRRLPIYLRALHILNKKGKAGTSSKGLADTVGANSWQVRKDFSYFGAFGKPGRGYDIENLKKRIAKILRLDSDNRVALIGVGNLGSAVPAYGGFAPYGFDAAAAYDCDLKKVGTKIHNVAIKNITGPEGFEKGRD